MIEMTHRNSKSSSAHKQGLRFFLDEHTSHQSCLCSTSHTLPCPPRCTLLAPLAMTMPRSVSHPKLCIVPLTHDLNISYSQPNQSQEQVNSILMYLLQPYRSGPRRPAHDRDFGPSGSTLQRNFRDWCSLQTKTASRSGQCSVGYYHPKHDPNAGLTVGSQ